MASYIDFTGKLSTFLTDDKSVGNYCLGRISFEWTRAAGPQWLSKDPGVYEQELEAFLLRDPGSTDSIEDNITVILGGIGTGKSTCIRRCIGIARARARVCTRAAVGGATCTATPKLIDLDFRGWNTSEKVSPKEKRDNYWNHLEAQVRQQISRPLNANDEVSVFWGWMLKQPKLLSRSKEVNRFFSGIEPKITAYANKEPYGSWTAEQILESLLRDRTELFRTLSHESLAWYQIFRLAHEQSSGHASCTCTYLLVDNVDGLEPDMQCSVVSIAQLLCGVLRARTIIAVRPLTWQNTQGEFLLEQKHHYSPAFADVFRERFDAFFKESASLDTHGISAARHLLTSIATETSPLHRMIKTTAGISIRYALRNVHNLMESPLMSAAFAKPTFTQSMNVRELARAYFFADEADMVPSAFENLYSVGHIADINRSLVKPRILDYIQRCRGGTAPTVEIFKFLAQFGHAESIIRLALDELMLRSRPLLWGEDGFEVVRADSKGRIMLTPIGTRYLDELFGEVFYDEVCIAKSAKDMVPLTAVLNFHKELTEADFREIAYAVEHDGSIFYASCYPQSMPALSFAHWSRMKDGLRNIQSSYEGSLVIDPKRLDWIAEQTRRLVSDLD